MGLQPNSSESASGAFLIFWLLVMGFGFGLLVFHAAAKISDDVIVASKGNSSSVVLRKCAKDIVLKTDFMIAFVLSLFDVCDDG